MPKNIVVCCDGTGNQFAVNETNVLRFHRVLEKSDPRQVTYYSPGVGTFSPSMVFTRPGEAFYKGLGLGLGVGYRQTIENAYCFIAEHFEEGDRIFLIGFSRGAYAARIVAALLHGVGILHPGHRHLVQYALAEIELRRGGNLDFQHLGRFRKQFSQTLDAKPFIFLGVWDTVSSISWAYDYLRYCFTASNPSADVVRHAISIDERRAFFCQNLFKHRENQDIKEVWFAGVHSDVGGGYRDEEAGLSKEALQWMMVQARDVDDGGLLFNEARVDRVLAGDRQSWHLGQLHKSLTWPWYALEFFPKENSWTRVPSPHLFRRRYPVVRSSGQANVPKLKVHESVVNRMSEKRLKYSPSNLPTEFEVEPIVKF